MQEVNGMETASKIDLVTRNKILNNKMNITNKAIHDDAEKCRSLCCSLYITDYSKAPT